MSLLRYGFSVALCMLTASAFGAPLGIRFDLKDGAKVGDVATIVARISGGEDVGIAKVEFMVDGQLRATDTSTPYSFEWDTLEETEGPHTIGATVFDGKGQTKNAKISVMIDNELSKGAD